MTNKKHKLRKKNYTTIISLSCIISQSFSFISDTFNYTNVVIITNKIFKCELCFPSAKY